MSRSLGLAPALRAMLRFATYSGGGRISRPRKAASGGSKRKAARPAARKKGGGDPDWWQKTGHGMGALGSQTRGPFTYRAPNIKTKTTVSTRTNYYAPNSQFAERRNPNLPMPPGGVNIKREYEAAKKSIERALAKGAKTRSAKAAKRRAKLKAAASTKIKARVGKAQSRHVSRSSGRSRIRPKVNHRTASSSSRGVRGHRAATKQRPRGTGPVKVRAHTRNGKRIKAFTRKRGRR